MLAKHTVYLKSIMENESTKNLLSKAMSTYPLYLKKSQENFIPCYIPTREALNEKILNFYKYREIGFETVGRFLDELEISLKEIMPYYNQLFFSADQDFNIIYNVDYERTRNTISTQENSVNGSEINSGTSESLNENTLTNTSLNTGNSKNNNKNSSNSTVENAGESNDTNTNNSSHNENSSSTNLSKKVHSATPQSELTITAKNIDNVSYADNVEWNKTENSSNSSGNSNSSGSNKNTFNNSSSTTENGNTENTSEHTETIQNNGSNLEESSSSISSNTTINNRGESLGEENVIETTKGNFGVVSAQDLILKYRETIINIEQMIINDKRIKELFLLVY